MERKEFLIQCGAACFSASLLATWLQSCDVKKAVVASYSDNQLSIPLNSFYTEKDGSKKWKRSVVLRHEQSAFPIVVFRYRDGEYKALLLRCTHQGSELNMYGDLITCSAHGSEFSSRGEVVKGPAETSLQQYPVHTDDQNIYIRIA
jgi:Rieske Fe-S protein